MPPDQPRHSFRHPQGEGCSELPPGADQLGGRVAVVGVVQGGPSPDGALNEHGPHRVRVGGRTPIIRRPPLPEEEVLAVVKSAIGYRRVGRRCPRE